MPLILIQYSQPPADRFFRVTVVIDFNFLYNFDIAPIVTSLDKEAQHETKPDTEFWGNGLYIFDQSTFIKFYKCPGACLPTRL